MKTNNSIALLIAFICLAITCNAFCINEPSYEDTVNVITETMLNSTSDARKESYDYLRFNKCSLDYHVMGTYPVGDLYDIKFTNIDFTSINTQLSKTGHDYTAFIILNFKNAIQYKDEFKEFAIRTVVVNVSSDEKAQKLFEAFLHLGKLCSDSKAIEWPDLRFSSGNR